MLTKLAPDLVINCAAYNYVDRAESEPVAAFEINAWAVKRLAVLCRDLGCTLVHFSTDYVFGLDAGRREPYGEADAPGPLSVYGLSKLSGEFMVRMHCPRHFVIRTCGLYGASGSGGKGGNFVETMLRLAREGKPLRVVADQVCTPSYTDHVAEAVVKLVQTDHFGIYHLTNAGSCSWYEFAQKIFALAGTKANLTAIGSAEYASAARRPGFSVLANARYEALGFPKLPVWHDAVEAYLRKRDRPR
jgi:dTDP-4-dehydrorhamnose reductase